jgi:hypothetical protein
MSPRYCKENVLWVCNQFEQLAKRDGITKAALREEYSMLESRRAQLERVRKDPKSWEYAVKRDLFDTLVKVLKAHDALLLTDDHLLLESIDGYLYHALSSWHGRRENPLVLTGKYSVFQPSATTGQVLLGELRIEHDQSSNSLSTVMRQRYQLEGMPLQEHFVRGVIVRAGSSRCIWLDKETNGQRYCSLDIVQSNTYENDAAESVTLMHGWSHMMSTRPIQQYIRRVVLLKCPESEQIVPGLYPLDERIPAMFRRYLTNSPDNLLALPPFERMAPMGTQGSREAGQ